MHLVNIGAVYCAQKKCGASDVPQFAPTIPARRRVNRAGPLEFPQECRQSRVSSDLPGVLARHAERCA
jgi:hypothetical protein